MTEKETRGTRPSDYQAPGKSRASVPIIYVDERGKKTRQEIPELKIEFEEETAPEKTAAKPVSKKASGEPPQELPVNPGEEPEKPASKKKKKGHGFLTAVLIIALLLMAEFIVLYFFAGKVNYQSFEAIAEEESYGLPEKNEKGVMNILLIGSDTRSQTERGQSDAMILVSICPLQHKIYLTSLLRDSYVDIPGVGKNRLNHAYTMGGARLLTQTIEQNFGVRVDAYVKVDFSAFIDVIDAFGGVEIEVTQPEIQYVDGYLAEVNILLGYPNEDCFIYEPGVYNFNGRQALAYSRIRYIGTDFGRTERQRTVIKALLKKIRKTNPVTTVKAGCTALQKVSTNFEKLPLTFLLMRAPFLLFYQIESSQIPADGLWWNDLMENGQEVLSMDMEATRSLLYERIYGAGIFEKLLN